MFYTYVLLSEQDSKLYSGYTQDLKLRFEQHEKGFVESTKHRRPLKLIYYEACLKQEDALKREKVSQDTLRAHVSSKTAQILFHRVEKKKNSPSSTSNETLFLRNIM